MENEQNQLLMLMQRGFWMNIDDGDDIPYAHCSSRLDHENEMQQFSGYSRKNGLIHLSLLFLFSLKNNQNDKYLRRMKVFGCEYCLCKIIVLIQAICLFMVLVKEFVFL